MNKQIIIPQSEWHQLKKTIGQIRESLEMNDKVLDLINREEACKVLNVSSKTLTNYLALGKITPDTINELDQMFFSRARLVGLKKKETA